VRLNERKEIEEKWTASVRRTSRASLPPVTYVTNAPEKQIIVAAGEGAKAALSAYRYLVRLHKE